MTASHAKAGGLKEVEVGGLFEATEEGGGEEAKHGDAGGTGGKIKGETAAIDVLALAEPCAVEAVLIVADEEEGGGAASWAALDFEIDGETPEADEGAGGCGDEGGPFIAAGALHSFAVEDHGGVDAERRVVDEGSGGESKRSDPGGVDPACVAGGDDCDRGLELEGEIDVFGEVVEGADGEDAHATRGAGDGGGDEVDGAISTGGDVGGFGWV